MRRIKICFPILVVLLIFCNALYVHAAQPVAIQEYVDKFSKETKCDSVSVAVVNDKGVEFYGDENGLYQIGSMTKAFTGLAIQKLISEGSLNESDSVSELLPGFVALYNSEPVEITVEQLLMQTSGYTNKEKDYPSATEDMSLADWVDSISGKDLQSKPGEKYAYSNVTYNLLGAIIENTTGKSYEDYMYEEILLPLGLTNTYVGIPEDKTIISGARLGYRQAFEYDISVYEGRIPAGYFYSNTTDMARWINIWLGTADIPDEYNELINTVKNRLGQTSDYYYGWELFENDVIGHSGGTPNYSSRIVFSEKENIGVCVLTNMNVAASTDALCNGLFSIAEGKDVSKIASDVWTIFDILFTALSALAILMIIVVLLIKKRGVVIGIGAFALILLTTICILMPAIFGAGLREIAFIWAPYSFAGGLLFLSVNIPVAIIKYLVFGNNENRKKACRRQTPNSYN